jgi:hypothetical protein
MPVLRPDVIKLDLRLVQEQPAPEIAAIAGAVGAQAERTGATVVAEGIETPEHVQYARALGATLGQGFHFGRALPPSCAAPTSPASRCRFSPPRSRVPGKPHLTWPALAAPCGAEQCRCSHRSAASSNAKRRGHRTSLLISSFPGSHGSLESIDTVYEELAANLAFVATLSVGISPNLRPGLRGVRIRDDDPFQGTWNVVVLGAHFAAMLAAREDGQAESDDDQAFHFVVTYDRDITVECGKPSCSALTGG